MEATQHFGPTEETNAKDENKLFATAAVFLKSRSVTEKL